MNDISLSFSDEVVENEKLRKFDRRYAASNRWKNVCLFNMCICYLFISVTCLWCEGTVKYFKYKMKTSITKSSPKDWTIYRGLDTRVPRTPSFLPRDKLKIRLVKLKMRARPVASPGRARVPKSTSILKLLLRHIFKRLTSLASTPSRCITGINTILQGGTAPLARVV
jgi:hypothetical protein